MPRLSSLHGFLLAIPVCLSQLGCDRSAAEAPAAPLPRPVTVFPLEMSQPEGSTRCTGSVTSWKTEDVGFEVGGRIKSIVEPGRDVEGPEITADGAGTIPQSGTELARIDPSRYQAQLASAQAQVANAKARLEAARREIEQVVPKQVAAATAARNLAQQEFDRQSALLKGSATTQGAYDKAAADLEVSIAESQQLDSTLAVKESEQAALAAQVVEAEEAVHQAELNLADTTLWAPFTGQIAAVHETVGGVVQAGAPVLQLQMMDPIQVDVQLSASRDSLLQYNDVVTVYTPDTEEPVPAMVYEKASVADAATRTFRLTLLTRNELITDGLPAEFDADLELRTRSVWGLFTRNTGDQGPYFVNEESLLQNATGEFFVLRVRGVSRRNVDERSDSMSTVLPVEIVPVVPSDERISFLGAAVLRRLEDAGELNPNTDLLVGRLRAMSGEPLPDADAAAAASRLKSVHLVRQRWRFRPGDVVSVDLSATPLPPGFYVPMNTIVLTPELDNRGFVVAIDAVNADGVGKAKRIPVRVSPHEFVGELRRIDPESPGDLDNGISLVADGAHYLREGDPLRVVRTIGATR